MVSVVWLHTIFLGQSFPFLLLLLLDLPLKLVLQLPSCSWEKVGSGHGLWVPLVPVCRGENASQLHLNFTDGLRVISLCVYNKEYKCFTNSCSYWLLKSSTLVKIVNSTIEGASCYWSQKLEEVRKDLPLKDSEEAGPC
jgi:hypothetical protein